MNKFKSLRPNTVTEIFAAMFILLFVYTSLSKFSEFNVFQLVLRSSPLIGDNYNIVAWGVPISELCIAILLFIPSTRLHGFYSALALMTLFTIYIGYMLLFTPKLPCSCGGVLKQMTWGQHFAFNLFFVFIAIVGIKFEKLRLKLTQSFVEQVPALI
jgi:hypothetical protein